MAMHTATFRFRILICSLKALSIMKLRIMVTMIFIIHACYLKDLTTIKLPLLQLVILPT